MNHVDGLVHVEGDKDADQEHVDVDEGADVTRPLLTVLEDAIAPVDREENLEQGQRLDHPDDGALET